MSFPKVELGKIDKIKVTKMALRLVVGAGVSTIVKGIVDANVETNSVKDQVTVAVAKVALVGVITVVAKSYTDDIVDKAINTFNLAKELSNKGTIEINI